MIKIIGENKYGDRIEKKVNSLDELADVIAGAMEELGGTIKRKEKPSRIDKNSRKKMQQAFRRFDLLLDELNDLELEENQKNNEIVEEIFNTMSDILEKGIDKLVEMQEEDDDE